MFHITRPVVACLSGLVFAHVGPASAQPTPTSALATAVAAIANERGADIAVAFRTLDGRDEFFLHDDEVFHAASTMKVPVMIELFRQAAEGRLSLDQPLPIVNEFKSLVDGSPFSLSASDDDETTLYGAVGQKRRARELCELMITVSSNLATNVLMAALGVESIQQTVVRLGATGMTVRRQLEDGKAYLRGLNNTTTARGLLVLMEAIASGKAVSPDASREMVEILKRQTFRDAIPAGLPPGTVVAHKTGGISTVNHDAAIVYGPRPYVLVVLVRGLDARARKDIIAEVSRAVYGAVKQTPASG